MIGIYLFIYCCFILLADPQIDRNFGGKKPNSGAEGSSLVELSGYNSKRHEFDPEYDNDAEQLLAEMEFKEPDTEDERELKLRVLRIYAKRYFCSLKITDFLRVMVIFTLLFSFSLLKHIFF